MPYRRSKPVATTGTDLSDSPGRAWEIALDQLEVQLNRAERMARLESGTDDDVLSWEPPTSTVSMPRYLVPRAKELLERQHLLIERLPELIWRPHGRVRLTDRVGRSGTAASDSDSSYVAADVSA